jgi:OOP family OmpA-OmpF porin
MRRESSRRILGFIAIAALLTGGCATSTSYQEPFAVEPLAVDRDTDVQIDRLVILFDASGSIDPKTVFPGEKAWVESFVQGMPDGQFEARILSYGGSKRGGSPLSPFDRSQLAADAKSLEFIGRDSPLDAVLHELAAEIEGVAGRSAVIVVTDGVPNSAPYGGPAEPALEAARAVVTKNGGTVCYHTVLAGDDEAGRALLEAIAALTPCGSYRSSSSISDAGSMWAFERDVFLAGGSPVRPPAAADSDGDGVADAMDECPGTPVGATVDDRGCWVLEGVRFGSDSAEIVGGGDAAIASIVTVLSQNPGLRVQITGYTDSSGSAAHNQKLSERRAETIRDRLVESGIDSARLDTVGYGEENPIADNDTAAGRAENRRIEFDVLR